MRFGCFVMTYLCSSLFLGHCSHEDLFVLFFDFLKCFNFSTDLLLNEGMDGPNKTFLPKNRVINHRYWFMSNPYHKWSFPRIFVSIKLVLDLDEVAIECISFLKSLHLVVRITRG